MFAGQIRCPRGSGEQTEASAGRHQHSSLEEAQVRQESARYVVESAPKGEP